MLFDDLTGASTFPGYALVCGDPARAEALAARLDAASPARPVRGFHPFVGSLDGVPVLACSHGIGPASAATVFERLIRAGCHTIIRVGTAGSLQRHIQDGDLVIATAAVREDGLTAQLVPLSYPAVADMAVTEALAAAARDREVAVSTGVVLTVGAFWPGVLPLPNNLMSEAGALAVEMEVAALYVVASLHHRRHRVRAGAILAIDGMAIDFDAAQYNPHRDAVRQAIERECDIAVAATRRLIAADRPTRLPADR